MKGQTWTPERKELVATLWREGKSASDIVAALGSPYVTRNAVIGVIHREGMSRKGEAHKTKPRPPAALKPKHPHLATIGKMSLPPEPVTPRATSKPEPPSFNFALVDLLPQTCKWAHGDGPFLFCGHAVKPDSVYCEHHDARAYNPPEPRRRRPWHERRAA